MPNPFDADTIQPNEDEVTVTLEDLVGEGRKYRDPNELAKAYNHADSYIQNLKAKEAEKDAELKVLKDLLEARNNGKTVTTETPPVRQETPPEQRETERAPDLNELVRKELNTAREEERRSNNINQAADLLNSHYGTPAKAQEAIRQKAQELGVKFEWLRDVASDSPQALFATMGINPRAKPQNTPGYNPDVNLTQPGTTRRNMNYYESIRKQDVKLYNSPEIRKQMMEDARSQGSDFFKN